MYDKNCLKLLHFRYLDWSTFQGAKQICKSWNKQIFTRWARVETTTSSGSSSLTLASKLVMEADLQSLRSGWAGTWTEAADQRPSSRHDHRARPVAPLGQGTMATSPDLVQFQLMPRAEICGQKSGRRAMGCSASTCTSTLESAKNENFIFPIMSFQSLSRVKRLLQSYNLFYSPCIQGINQLILLY